MYCWGNSLRGELGTNDVIWTPKLSNWVFDSEIQQVSNGLHHVLILTNTGQVYGCGYNNFGQLGMANSKTEPQKLPTLESLVMIQIACGDLHSVALNEWGQVFTWGCDSHGQLGHGTEQFHKGLFKPKMVKALGTKRIVQIACGCNHTVALTNGGEVYSWGGNSDGQLGIGTVCTVVRVPSVILALRGLPVSQIACGSEHTVVTTRSGSVYSWGRNRYGQLGNGQTEQRQTYPVEVRNLRRFHVARVICGTERTLFMTRNGGVLSCGAILDNCGLLSSDLLPRMVQELMGTVIIQVACGTRHSLAVSSSGRLYVWGCGFYGALGFGIDKLRLKIPTYLHLDTNQLNMHLKCVFAGGELSFVTMVHESDKNSLVDMRVLPTQMSILDLNEQQMNRYLHISEEDRHSDEFWPYIEQVFNCLGCLNASFIKDDDHIFKNESNHHCIDFEAAERTFDCIARIENTTIRELILQNVIDKLIPQLSECVTEAEALRCFLLLPLYHEFCNPRHHQRLQEPFGQAVKSLTSLSKNIVISWWLQGSSDYFERLVNVYKNIVIYLLQQDYDNPLTPGSLDPDIKPALEILEFLNKLNNSVQGLKVPYDTFHIPEINSMRDVRVDYLAWLHDNMASRQHLCNYPFIFNAEAKIALLQTDQAIQMQSAMNDAASRAFLMVLTHVQPDAISQYLVLNVSRENIVMDTLQQLTNVDTADLKKPLKVRFQNEEADDAGGVRKEFFMLLVRELFDKSYGIFEELEPAAGTLWFAENTFESELMYSLIGIVCGLAIYNFTIIALPFPLALYKKLLGEPVGLADLQDLTPTLARSLQQLLDYDGTNDNVFQDTFALTFEISRDAFGAVKTIPLKHNGGNIPVTLATRKEYVDLYVDYILNKSIRSSYLAFSTGFLKVCDGRVLKLFHSHELQSVIVGNQNYDWKVLEENAEYKDGYNAFDETIVWFWEVFQELSLEDKKKFLLFLTGSDRVPLTGMKTIRIIIQPTSDDKYLPVAHTCFNLLDLPRYRTKERLRYKLLQAIQQTEGFSLV